MAQIPAHVVELIAKFDAQSDLYRSPTYNETQLRIDFINPMFRALGWDIDNTKGYAEAFREVVHEDAVRIGGTVKSPDYSFRIGGRRIFFLEAKKPAVNIKDDTDPAYQLRRYAWTAKLPVSILTNFKEFAVYDCRVKPIFLDKASTARLLYFTYKEYAQRWDEIVAIFAPESIQQGAFDRYVQSRKKKGTQEFDDAFLDEMEDWRKWLALNLALRNSTLDESGLNFATQRIIDRIIFLRICEDRGIEPPFQLQALLSGQSIYVRLQTLFHKADQRYNSGIFHFHKEKNRHELPDELTPSLEIDDSTLKDIIKRLYYPDSPYVFKEVPADILGNVYERFLGNVIHLTAGHRAKVEPKPQVLKANGVFYTPTYIVNYIVQNTVGKLLESKTPASAAKLRILDPACGSGSFLLGAYQYLLDWHQQWYQANDPAKWSKGKNPTLRPGPAGELVLSIRERKRILIDSVYGVDLDPQAVEVTKLSLLLKCLEGESAQSINDLLLFHERALPDLGDNIKCGNSLISTDFCQTEIWKVLSDERRSGFRPFDWQREFITTGGFDAVIGNPPWGADIREDERPYLSRCFPMVADYESSQYFVMQGLSLVSKTGKLGFILPNTFALNVYARSCRDSVLERSDLEAIVDLSDMNVFLGPSVRSIILISAEGSNVCDVSSWAGATQEPQHLRKVDQPGLAKAETWKGFLVRIGPCTSLVERIANGGPALSDCCEVKQGYIPYRTTTLTRRFGVVKAAQIVNKRLWHSDQRISADYQRELQGADVGRYSLQWSGTWVRYGDWVSTFLPLSVFSGPRVLIREITGHLPRALLATYTEETLVHNPSVLAVLPRPNSVSLKFTLGILNSRLMSVIFLHVAPKAQKGLFPKVIITDARRLSFPDIDIAQRTDRVRHDHLVSLVDQMLCLHKSMAAAQSPTDKEALHRQMDATDRQIDQLVYNLYGLSEDEIRIVEQCGQPPVSVLTQSAKR